MTRQILWDELEIIHTNEYPWILLGDFNTICQDTKRFGGHPRPFFLCRNLMIVWIIVD